MRSCLLRQYPADVGRAAWAGSQRSRSARSWREAARQPTRQDLAAGQAAVASSVNRTVKLPRWRKLASYGAQLVTLRFCLGIWVAACSVGLERHGGIRVRTGRASYPGQTYITNF
jgi:hypothetical protein